MDEFEGGPIVDRPVQPRLIDLSQPAVVETFANTIASKVPGLELSGAEKVVVADLFSTFACCAFIAAVFCACTVVCLLFPFHISIVRRL